MPKPCIIVHGGAGGDPEFVKNHEKEIRKGLATAVAKGYRILKDKGTAVEAVEAAVNVLEDDPHFNAGRGSALNARGEVEMCASIMDGKQRNSGAVAIVRNVKNPISLAKAVMTNTDYIYLGDAGAMEYAKKLNLALAPDAYFITQHQYDAFEKKRREEFEHIRDVALDELESKMHGTVGAVALDHNGNLAAGTSTGGTVNSKPGRIGDSSMIGIGTFANNLTCGISTTGDGEYLIRGMVAHSISSQMLYRRVTLRKAADDVIHHENKGIHGDIGMIGIDHKGSIVSAFNCEILLRGWISAGKIVTRVYKNR